MKLVAVFFVAIFGLTTGSTELTEDLLDFVDLLPVDEINEIVLKYAEDEEFLNIIIYVLYDEEFKSIVLEAETISEFMEFVNYLEASGLEIYVYLNLLHDAIGLPPFIPPSKIVRSKRSARVTLTEIRNEIRAIMPKEKIAALHDQKMVSSEVFKYLAERLEADEIRVLLDNLLKNEDIQRISQTLDEKGVDIKDNMIFYLEFFGFRPFNKLSHKIL